MLYRAAATGHERFFFASKKTERGRAPRSAAGRMPARRPAGGRPEGAERSGGQAAGTWAAPITFADQPRPWMAEGVNLCSTLLIFTRARSTTMPGLILHAGRSFLVSRRNEGSTMPGLGNNTRCLAVIGFFWNPRL